MNIHLHVLIRHIIKIYLCITFIIHLYFCYETNSLLMIMDHLIIVCIPIYCILID